MAIAIQKYWQAEHGFCTTAISLAFLTRKLERHLKRALLGFDARGDFKLSSITNSQHATYYERMIKTELPNSFHRFVPYALGNPSFSLARK